jgi:hypothetical protein
MLLFQEEPDPIFVAIVHTALEYLRDVHLVRYRQGYQPTPAERRELDDSYADLLPELAPFFTRRRLIAVIERLLRASRDTRRRYRLTDYHWLVLYACLSVYCDLHNDEATGTGDTVGAYEIEHIDFDAIVERFFFDTDFLLGSVLLQAEERAPGQLQTTREAWKIAARLKPAPDDLRLTPVSAGEAIAAARESPRPVPSRGYVGPYPLHEREDADEPS